MLHASSWLRGEFMYDFLAFFFHQTVCIYLPAPQWLSSCQDSGGARGLGGTLQKRSLHRGKHRPKVLLADQLSRGKINTKLD